MDDHLNLVPDLVRRAVECVLREDYDASRTALLSGDYERLVSDREAAVRARRARLATAKVWGPGPPGPSSQSPSARRRTEPGAAVKRATFERDHFICRYSHCLKRTIYLPVLRAMSAVFPEIIPYNSNWTPLEELIVYWTFSTSIEHRISFPHGGTSDPENLITACYQCNDIKNMTWAGDLAWEVAEIREVDWDGLSSYLPDLEKFLAAQRSTRSRQTKAGMPSKIKPKIVANSGQALTQIKTGSLIAATLPGKKARRHYRVAAIDKDRAVLYEMWRRDSDRVWVQSPRSNVV